MTKFYVSTRNNNIDVSASEAVLLGLSDDGGLFVPKDINSIKIDINELIELDYKEICKIILNKFLPDFTEEQIKYSVDNAYDEKSNHKEITPLKKVGEDFFLELFHGKTLAFKDVALSILPYLMKESKENCKLNKEILILTATSGDTGKAALEGFKDVEGISIIVFYPEGGVSKIQELQMKTQEGKNTYVYAIEGNFDDAQNMVKQIFNDNDVREKLYSNNVALSSANSINIGRLIPQIVYYFSSYIKLVKEKEINLGDKINYTVPTGNFGNILAGYIAKTIGLPVNKLICAANENNVLTDFIKTGEYNIQRDFIKTISPSMDILISSNLERLIYFMSGGNSSYIKNIMEELKTNKKYKVDTHTAVAYDVYNKYKEKTKDKSKTVILSTASPFKFIESVYLAIESKKIDTDKDLIRKFSKKYNLNIPKELSNIEEKKKYHDEILSIDKVEGRIIQISEKIRG